MWISRVTFSIRYRAEKLQYEGKNHSEGNGKKSIIFFTHYRCASMMLVKRLKDLLHRDNYQQIDYQGYVHKWTLDKREEFQFNTDSHEEHSRFNKKGRLYAPLRYFVAVPDINDYSKILVLRDPRDVMVSRFYSEKFAHIRMDKRFKEHCDSISQLSLDEFVLEYAEQTLEHYELFLENYKNWTDVLFVRYEDVISDFEGFLAQCDHYLCLGRSDSEIKEIAHKESFVVVTEDKYAHKRSVKARGFESKLNEATIDKLNEVFSDVIDGFGWEK